MSAPKQAKAQAPASIANLAVGFDLLGQAFDGCYDKITARRSTKPGIYLGKVSGLTDKLPTQIIKNTALRGADALLQAVGNPFGVVIDVQKHIPLSAGLGGSAASSVGAVLAVNALLEKPFAQKDLLSFALEGERASSDPPPKDNISACLFGGLVLVTPGKQSRVIALPSPKNVVAIVIHPDLKIETGISRKTLAANNPLAQTIEFAGRLAAFTHACHSNDIRLLREVMQDILIEPQRAASIPPFYQAQQAALKAGAICCSISGSGPSLFAWAMAKDADLVAHQMQKAVQEFGISANSYQSPLTTKPAELI